MAKELYVITSPEAGWDCVIAVVTEISDALERLCDQSGWIIHSKELETSASLVNNYGDDE